MSLQFGCIEMLNIDSMSISKNAHKLFRILKNCFLGLSLPIIKERLSFS